MKYTIRHEERRDHRIVEEITRKAFWNLYIPGCNEHYLVHIMRDHPDFIPELDYVIELDGVVIGNIMYTKSTLVGSSGKEKGILTFGPVCILPAYQRKGFGSALISYTFRKAVEMQYDAVVIYGNPGNYVNLGFKSCTKYDVAAGEGIYPTAMLVKELTDGALHGERWMYKDSGVYRIDEHEADAFDLNFEKMEKQYRASQEEFYILSHSRMQKA